MCNFCPETGASVKADDLRDRLGRLRQAGHRALVFSQWTSETYGVARVAGELNAFHPLAYTGALGLAERTERIESFRANPQHVALILSLRAGGQGLNLQEASYVFHFDRWWNPAVENQASDRVHRLGQRNPVTVYAYTCVDTIEERIEQILDAKRALFAALVDQVSFDVRRLLTAEELFGLFGLAVPARPRRRRELPAARDPLARVTGLLKRSGWTRFRSLDRWNFEAHRGDELGRMRVLRVRWLERWDDRVLDTAVVEDDQQDEEISHLILCGSGFPPEAGAAARARGVALLDEEALLRIEEAGTAPEESA